MLNPCNEPCIVMSCSTPPLIFCTRSACYLPLEVKEGDDRMPSVLENKWKWSCVVAEKKNEREFHLKCRVLVILPERHRVWPFSLLCYFLQDWPPARKLNCTAKALFVWQVLLHWFSKRCSGRWVKTWLDNYPGLPIPLSPWPSDKHTHTLNPTMINRTAAFNSLEES